MLKQAAINNPLLSSSNAAERHAVAASATEIVLQRAAVAARRSMTQQQDASVTTKARVRNAASDARAALRAAKRTARASQRTVRLIKRWHATALAHASGIQRARARGTVVAGETAASIRSVTSALHVLATRACKASCSATKAQQTKTRS
jgi:hypothetical protein